MDLDQNVSRKQKIRQLQDLILAKVERQSGPLPEIMVRAFRQYPRHEFVDHFRSQARGHWVDLNSGNLEAHLDEIYSDQPLVIWGEKHTVSTISQPSFVLLLLKLLDLHAGQNVFELGAGSGWNAALMGALSAPGEVYSYEIIPELAALARERIQRFGLNHVHVVTGDGMELLPEGLTFQRGIFTAGAPDLPRGFYHAIADGGRLLFVLKQNRHTDLLLVLNKDGNAFHSERIHECGFVPVTGPHGGGGGDPMASEMGKILKDAKSVRILPSDHEVLLETNQMVMIRPQSQFIWTV